MAAPQYAKAIAFALHRLRAELSPALVYHNVWHTEHDVMPAADQLALESGVAAADVQLLRVAAAYHDIGMIYGPGEHERQSAAIAAKVLPNYGFDSPTIERVVGMIMATRLPQSPHTLLEQILADADLDVLGRDDFLERNRLLREELSAQGRAVSDQQWFASQYAFLHNHSYFTPAARSRRTAGKRENLERFVAQFAINDPRTAVPGHEN